VAASIPASHLDLFKKIAFANLATINADGTPQVTPVWVDWDGTHVVLNTARGRVKDRNLQRNPNVAMSITDPDNPYRYLGIQGRVVKMTEDGADAHIDKMAKKYFNKDKYPYRAPGEVRVLVLVEPTKVHAIAIG
jgi:PPOX class probable F420-dependent enzyme